MHHLKRYSPTDTFFMKNWNDVNYSRSEFWIIYKDVPQYNNETNPEYWNSLLFVQNNVSQKTLK